jgi:hypothetical protein
MLNNGLGFSDEFELEACNYSEKSSSKLKQQYKEWTYTMRKEGSAFFKTVKNKVKQQGHFSICCLCLFVAFRNHSPALFVLLFACIQETHFM